MKTEKKKNQKSDETANNKKTKVASPAKIAADENFAGELNAPRWSVVSFENRVASNLTYEEAVKKLNRLKAKKISGLCVITDEAASRIREN